MSTSANDRGALRRMLEPRSIAVVGASARPGSFGERMATEVLRSRPDVAVHLVNPHYDAVADRPCVDSLDDIAEPVDLVLLGVGDASLEALLTRAAARGDRSAVVFGNAYEKPADGVLPLRDRLAAIARSGGMALCGGGCMGFVNVSDGVRAIGYVEPAVIPGGPVALVTHSGSVFSAMLRARRGIGFNLAVSSGQELVTTTAAYLDYALSRPETGVIALVLETIREPTALRSALALAAERDVPVVVLPVGTSEPGGSMVEAHSGAVAGRAAAWEALTAAHGLHLVSDLSELLDTVELFAAGRRARPRRPRAAESGGLAAVLDSGAERALLADVAADLGIRFAAISTATTAALSKRLDPGLVAANPLDVWGNGADSEGLLSDVMMALAADAEVQALALAVDLVVELDGDESYLLAAKRVAAAVDLPVVVLTHVPAALDTDAAAELRSLGVPVLEGTRTGLLAIRHLLDRADRVADQPSPHRVDAARQARWAARLAGASGRSAADRFALLADYGIPVADTRAVSDDAAVLAAAAELGYPVVLKTGEDIAHKTDVGGVVVGLATEADLLAAYRDLAGRLGARALVCRQAPTGIELLAGAVRDPSLGMLLVVGPGGILVEQIAERAAALPPIDAARARRLLAGTSAHHLLANPRGRPPADVDAVANLIAAFSGLVDELGDSLDAIEINPVICSPSGALAVDVHLDVRGSAKK